jgi:hypothetical protein
MVGVVVSTAAAAFTVGAFTEVDFAAVAPASLATI